jgi:hypothetical protein
MTTINASSIFNASMVSAAFDAAITTDASHGRVSALFSQALESAYGLALPASPAQAVKTINALLTAPKAPKLAHGPGATGQAVNVARVLHTLALALAESGRVKALPAVADLPAWADPVALAAKAEAAKAAKAAKPATTPKARKVTAPSKVVALDVAPTVPTAPGVELPEADHTEQDTQALNRVIAAIKAGRYTSAQHAALRSALEGAMVAI